MEHPQEILDVLRRMEETVGFARENKRDLLGMLEAIEAQGKICVNEALEISEYTTNAAQCAAGLGVLIGIMKSYIEAYLETLNGKKDLKKALELVFSENSILKQIEKADSEAKGLIILLTAGKIQMEKIDFSDLLPK